MQQLLTRGIPGWHQEYQDTELGEIPSDWQIKSIQDLGKQKKNIVQTGPFGAQLHSSDYVEQGVPFILIKNIQDNKIST